MSWRDLFDRAASHEVSIDEVTERLRERRDGR